MKKELRTELRIAIAQINYLVGDIEGNAQRVIQESRRARDELKADLIVFPELTLTGYPPEDLLLRPRLYTRVEAALKTLCEALSGIYVVIGYPEKSKQGCFNKACVIHDKGIIAHYSKQRLPNYGVFDEMRYFEPGPPKACVVDIKGIPTALTICEDLWHPEPMAQAAKAGAQLMLCLNASPFYLHKPIMREEIMADRAKEGHMPVVYVNCVGGQDELVFDGESFIALPDGVLCQTSGPFEEELSPIDLIIDKKKTSITSPCQAPERDNEEERTYQALVTGVRDYIEKNHFPSATIGLSGGIDSGLTLAIAVDALGPERVEALLMPSRYTDKISVEDAVAEAEALGVTHHIISIEPTFNAFLESLKDEFAGLAADVTEENIQARCRGILLMAVSNKKHSIVLSTGNKSEMAVGYATLYGDMVGGFCVLKDVPKTWVYRLAKYRNGISPVIPERVIERPPSAELAADQVDQDSLPPYDILDAILEAYVENDRPPEEIIAAGFDPAVVNRVVEMVTRNEYKRRQAPPGVRITHRAFGRDRRYPITSGYVRRR